MDKIEQKLADVNLGVNDLPPQLKKLIDAVDTQADKLEAKIQAYEDEGNADEEVEKKFQDSLALIEERENYIVEKIEEYNKQLLQKESDDKVVTPSDEPKPTEKKKLGIGAILLGVAVLAVTLGAVNVMKK
jgi:chromosome segregation ATPase